MKTRSPSEIARLTDVEAEKFNAARPRICAEPGCGYACAPADIYCRKHGGDEAACGICGDVTCPGHDGRTGARLGPVAAVALDDHCSRCFCLIDVAEPIFGAIGQGIWCARCNEKSAVPGCDRCGAEPGAECDPALHNARWLRNGGAVLYGAAVTELRTSSLLRHTAAAVRACAAGPLAAHDSALARELDARALLIGQAAESAAERCGFVHRMGCACDLLREIGEVRS